ncbi:MAG: ABC transporter substrate-binding protein [Longimicrobiales bacterium]|nr:ABC transporter substrate-binding protein [Longimicrobiales bacterium]
MKKLFLLFVTASFAACGGAEATRNVSSDPFCQRVIPAVDAWLADARTAYPTPDDDRYGGTVVVGTNGEIADGMNAAVAADYNATQHHQFVNLMTLIDFDNEYGPRGYLAESWEFAEDMTSVTFRIRQDVFWHDGEQTDAHDVAFTYLTVTDPETAFPNAAFWSHYVPGEDGVEILDDFTVRIRMRPHSMPLDPFRTVGILPEHLLGDVPRSELKQHPFGSQCPVGNGPFVFYSHTAQDRWVFEANPAFPEGLGGRPFVNRYVYRAIPEQTTLLAELLTGGIDVYVQPTPEQAQNVLDSEELDLRRFVGRSYMYVGWNARLPKLSDARVRTAMGMGVDRQSLVDGTLGGYGRIANSGVPPFHFAFDADLESPVSYDPAGARALLEEAGWVDRDGDGIRENAAGEPLEIVLKYNPHNLRQAIAEVMQAQLSEVGVAITPQSVEFTTLIDQIASTRRDFEGVVMGWNAEFRLDDTDLFRSDRIDQPYAFSGTQNSTIDRLIDALSTTVDEDASRALWIEYQRAIMEEQPYTYFYFRDRLVGVNRRLQGVEMDVRGEWTTVRDWYIDPASP